MRWNEIFVLNLTAHNSGTARWKNLVPVLYVVGYEKRDHIAHFPNFHFKMFITIADTDLNFGMNILLSSCYTHKEFWTPPISDMGRASTCINHVQKSPFYASLWQLTARDRRLAVASNVGSVEIEGPNCLQTKWKAWGSYGLEMVAAWKTAKNRILCDMVPFLISYHIL